MNRWYDLIRLLYVYISSANANPPPCLTRAWKAPLNDQRYQRAAVAFFSACGALRCLFWVPFGHLGFDFCFFWLFLALLGGPGRPRNHLWTTLAPQGTKREAKVGVPGRILLRLGSILRCFLAYFAKNRRFFKWRFPDRFFHRFWSASGYPGTSKNKQNHDSVARKQGLAKI